MDAFHALVLGTVEGLTEFLPVSSTGHLILTARALGIPSSDFVKSFEIAIQLGAILAVVAVYFRSFFDVEIIKRLIIGFIPTGIIGFALYSVVKTYFFGNDYIVLAALALGGIALIAFELLREERFEPEDSTREITYTQSALVGLCQALAIVPGVSRSAATIVGGLMLGIPRKTIVEFSFLLAVPTMAAATGYDMLKNASAFSHADFQTLAIGFTSSFVVAMLAIKLFIKFVRNSTFIPFGIYRIVVAFAFWLFILH